MPVLSTAERLKVTDMKSILQTAFNETIFKYSLILNNYYPAHKSTGFTERNLTTNFVSALEEQLGKQAFAWYEAPLHTEEKLHLDAVVFDKNTSSCFLIESKRFSNLKSKIAQTKHDIERMSHQVHHETLERGLRDFKIEHRYAVVLVDIWTEGTEKTNTYLAWPKCLGDENHIVDCKSGFESLVTDKEWKHNYKIMMAVKKL